MALIFGGSRYQYKPLEQDGPVVRIPYFKVIQKTDYPDNITIRLKDSDRLDTLSFNLYGTSHYDWVIAEFNNLKLPFEELKSLDTIIVPSPQTLFNSILPSLKNDFESLR